MITIDLIHIIIYTAKYISVLQKGGLTKHTIQKNGVTNKTISFKIFYFWKNIFHDVTTLKKHVLLPNSCNTTHKIQQNDGVIK